MMESRAEMSLSTHVCTVCEKSFSQSSNLYNHLRKIHHCEPLLPTNLIKCAVCNCEFPHKKPYLEHLSAVHDITVESEVLQFESMEVFNNWKKEEENKNFARFVKKSGSKRSNDKVVSLFYCHRSGVFVSKGKGERQLKQKGSNYINSNCPAMIKVMESKEKITVEFTKTHVGHLQDTDLQYLIPTSNMSAHQDIPTLALDAVLKKSSALPKNKVHVKGYDFNDGIDYHALLQSYKTSGFQATNFGLAVDEINKMISCRNQPFTNEDILETDPFIQRKTNCSIFLGYTSNMASAGVRDTIRYLVQHKLVDCVVTSAGGVEEDLIKCLAPTIIGDFSLDGSELRDKGLNRIGNLLVPNENYCLFENWLMPILDECLEEQDLQNFNIWSPSKIITRLGLKINNTESICYWAAKNEIPIFCPALTDGSLGDMMFFHSFRKKPELIVDINQDLRRIHSIALKAVNSGMIILGGGVVKHHICNSNLMRNGADYAVFINTAHEFDGSDSGARPDEAVSWGKIKKAATPVKVYADATLVFPLIVAETFAPYVHKKEGGR